MRIGLALGFCASSQQLTIGLGVDFGSKSHARGLLEVGTVLQDLGHQVVFATMAEKLSFSDGFNITTVDLGSYPDYFPELQKLINAQVLTRNPTNLASAASEFRNKVIPGIYKVAHKGFTSISQENRVDLWACDIASSACKDVADEFEIPYIGFSQVKEFLHLEVPNFMTDGTKLLPIYIDELSVLGRLQNKLPGIFKVLHKNLLNIFGKHPREIKELILLDTFIGFEPAYALPPNIRMIGPLLDETIHPLDSDMEEWMEAHDRVMYAGLGSEIGMASFDFENILLASIYALNANSLDGVVWSLGTFNNSLIPAYVSLNGVSINTTYLLEQYRQKLIVEKWLPQQGILGHKNTKVFLTHGGMSSILEAIRAGVPTLCFPMTHEQPRNAYKLRDAGISIFVDRLTVTPEELSGKISQVLHAKEFKYNLKTIQVIAGINTLDGIRQKKIHAAHNFLRHAYTAQACRPTLGPHCELRHITMRSDSMNYLVSTGLDIKLFLLVSALLAVRLLVALAYQLGFMSQKPDSKSNQYSPKNHTHKSKPEKTVSSTR